MRVLIFKILGAMAIIALILSCGYLYHIHNTKLNEIVDQLNRWNISVGQDFPRECPTGSKQTAGMGSLMAAFNAPEDTILSKECVFEEPVKDTQSITTSMRSLTFKRGGAKLLGSISLELKPDIKSGDKLIACSEEGLSLFSGNKDGFIQEALPDNPVILKMLPPNTKQIIYRQVVEMDGGLFVQLSCNIAVRTIYVHFFTDYSYTEKGVLYDKNRRFNFSNFGTPPLFSAVTNFGYQSYLAEINEQISKHEEHRSELSPLGKKLLDDTIALARDKQRFINHFVVTNKLTRAIALSSASGTTTDIIKQRAFYSRSPCLKNCIADKNNIGAPSCKAQSDLERTKADSTTYA